MKKSVKIISDWFDEFGFSKMARILVLLWFLGWTIFYGWISLKGFEL